MKLVATGSVLVYAGCVTEEDGKQMSAVGKKLWVYMQEKGPYNMRALVRMLKRRGILSTTHQSVSKWLHKDYPAPYFVNAVVKGLDLSEQEEIDLHYTYFYGDAVPAERHRRVSSKLEAEEETEDGAISGGKTKDQAT